MKGYGRVTALRRRWTTHRFAWAIANDRDPGELLVCHRCDNPPCVNPAHLFLGTHLDNNRDAAAKGRLRGPHWTRHNRVALTPDVVREIRQRIAAGETIKGTARRIGVVPGTIYAVLSGLTWKHVS
jgi:hypothetical protein